MRYPNRICSQDYIYILLLDDLKREPRHVEAQKLKSKSFL